MTPTIRLDMRLTHLIQAFPETRQIFETCGLKQLISSESLEAIGPFLTLESALLTHGVSPQSFMNLLRQNHEKSVVPEAPDHLENNASDPVNLLALMTCGLKFPFARALASFINNRHESDDRPVTYSVVSNLNHEHSYYPYVNHIRSLEDLPDIIISSDFNTFFYHRFFNEFIRPGYFTDVMPYEPNAAFTTAGICDPHRQYTIMCVNPLIIVADLKKTGNRPLPCCWTDLLDPIWRKSVTLRGNEHFFCHAVLLPFYKEHGKTAMQSLAANVFDGRHPAQMVKSAGNGRSAALYVMPDFFARKIPAHKSVKLIWPLDGALASPVTLLVKKEKAEQLKMITDYLLGEELARIFAEACFPSPHPAVGAGLSAKTGLKWIGWDYIRANDLEKINTQIDRIFLPAVKRGLSS